MKCKKIRRLLPLASGSDLPPSMTLAVDDHLKKCPLCRKEFEMFVLSLQKTKEWLQSESREWREHEWRSAVRNALQEDTGGLSPLAPWPFKKIWAYSLMSLCAVILSLLFIQPSFISKKRGFDPRKISIDQRISSARLRDLLPQDVISMTLISKATGLKVIWFLNKNFNLEETE